METRFFSLTGYVIGATSLTVEDTIDLLLGESRFEMQQLFTGGRMPNVVVATDGMVLATWGATEAIGNRWWDKGLQVRRSEDGGKTWGDPITIANPGWQGGGLTVDETTGDILAFVEAHHPPASLTVYRSSDHGKTWQPQETVVQPDRNGNVPSMHMAEHGITLRHGEQKGRLLRPTRWYGGEDNRANFLQHYNTAIYSDDGGATWHTSNPFPAMGTGEGAVAELSDGRIYYNSRRHWDPDGLKLMRWEAWSDDGGETWTDLTVSTVLPDGPLDPAGGCHGGLVRLPVPGRDVLLYSNCDSPSGRKDMAVWASFDGGKTWPIKRRVFDGPCAYSSLNAGRPGTSSEGWLYLLFEGGQRHKYEGGYLARFNLSWLLEGEKTCDGELSTWIRQAKHN